MIKRIIFPSLMGLIILAGFNNCSGDFQSLTVNQQSSSGENQSSPTASPAGAIQINIITKPTPFTVQTEEKIEFELINTSDKDKLICKFNNSPLDDCKSPILLTNLNEGIQKLELIIESNNCDNCLKVINWTIEPTDYVLDPYSYEVNPNFDVNDLPSEKMKKIHADWWAAHESPQTHYQHDPKFHFDDASTTEWKSNGTYSIGRHGGRYLNTIMDFMRTTGDPKALEELLYYSDRIKKILKDHDGRGYVYFQYAAPDQSSKEDNQHNLDDTHYLDEILLGGSIARLGLVLHENRRVSKQAEADAKFWFSYLDENFLPKWMYRKSYYTSNKYVPPAELKLQNAVFWNGGVGGSGGNAKDVGSSWGHSNSADQGKPMFNEYSDLVHKYPAHPFSHSYSAGMYMFMALGKYFKDTGKKPVSAIYTGTVDDFLNEAKVRHDWWFRKLVSQADGSTEWSHFMNRQSGGTRWYYSITTIGYLHSLHWSKFYNFSKDNTMIGFAKVWYNGDPISNEDVLTPNNTDIMALNSDGKGGSTPFYLSSGALLGCWDSTGVILSLNDQVIISPTKHKIVGNTNKHHNDHHNAILSCELKKIFEMH